MNLMKLFNKDYLLQNLKKSRTVLAIFIGLIPILNTILLIMILTSNSSNILTFGQISIINLIGIYILPIVISICLFNYIYKKKSVDFINSMPISRKSIFITNTILGIMIFTIMLLINIILIYAVTTIFNAPIPLMMLFDYFCFFLLVYIFSFSATNLAMTISGNAITQIVVTLLLFFLVPYTTLYIDELYKSNTYYNVLLECNDETCKPDKYYCYDDLDCTINKELNRYQNNLMPITTHNYTTPFGLLYNITMGDITIINPVSVVKMLLLSIIYIVLGFILFLKRKMEVSETSFKNIHIHNLVKSLTLVPFVSIAYSILENEELIFTIFVIVILLIYYFVYDLITKKSIQNIKLSCLYFVITLICLITIFSIASNQEEKTNIVKYTDIKEIAIDISNYSGRSDNTKIYIKDKDLINLMVKSMLNEENTYSEYITTYFKTSNNREYKTSIRLTEKAYDEMINLLSKKKEYINYYKNIDLNETYTAVQIGNQLYNKKEAKPYLELINNTLKDLSLKEFIELQQNYLYISNDYRIKIYTYKNHDIKEFSISAYINYDLLNSIVNSNNKLLKDNITPVIPEDYYLYYENAYLVDTYNIDFYLIRSAKKELYEFMLKNASEEVDMRYEYFSFNVQLDYNTYHFTTNKVDEIKNILNKKYEELKDTEDYKNYYDDTKEESVEYYD